MPLMTNEFAEIFFAASMLVAGYSLLCFGESSQNLTLLFCFIILLKFYVELYYCKPIDISIVLKNLVDFSFRQKAILDKISLVFHIIQGECCGTLCYYRFSDEQCLVKIILSLFFIDEIN